MKAIRWSARASRQLHAIHEEISASSETAATRQLELIWRAVDRLALFPLSGPVFKQSRLGRQLTVPGTKYIVLYRILNDVIDIVTIRHGHKNH